MEPLLIQRINNCKKFEDFQPIINELFNQTAVELIYEAIEHYCTISNAYVSQAKQLSYDQLAKLLLNELRRSEFEFATENYRAWEDHVQSARRSSVFDLIRHEIRTFPEYERTRSFFLLNMRHFKENHVGSQGAH